MKEVTKEAFFKVINQFDVHPQPVGRYPYTSIWKTRVGLEVGRTVDTEQGGMVASKYYLLDSWAHGSGP